jgi:hypothetical protein
MGGMGGMGGMIYKTGWYGISISLGLDEIDTLIELLNGLKEDNEQHFHLSSDFSGEGGVGDIEINVKGETHDNMSFIGFPIHPNR